MITINSIRSFVSEITSSEVFRDQVECRPKEALETCHGPNETLSEVLYQRLKAKNESVVLKELKLNEDVEILSLQVTSRNIFRPCSLCCGRRTTSDW